MIKLRINEDSFNPIYRPLIHDKETRLFILYGGRNTGKSHFIAQRLVMDCMTLPYFKCVLIRKQHNTIKDSQYSKIKKVVSDWGLSQFFDFVSNPLEIRCKLNDNIFIARGCDDTEKLKSLDDPTHAHYEEVDALTEEQFDDISMSLRTETDTPIQEWASFNPGSEKHWIVTNYFPELKKVEKPDGSHSWINSTQKGVKILHTTYLDNDFIDDRSKEKHQVWKEQKPSKYRRHSLGLFGIAVDGALWDFSMLDPNRVQSLPALKRAAVAIDPSASDHKDSDEAGIIAGGVGYDGRFYLYADRSGIMSPTEWAKAGIELYNDGMCDVLIGEKNNGGDMIKTIVKGIDHRVNYKGVHASKGKKTRAEPIAALYEQGKVSHVGNLAELEDEMTTWDATKGDRSPNRVDAAVWLLTELNNVPRNSRIKKRTR